MSLTAVLVMAVVVLVLLAAWLIAVFRAARQPASGHRHPGGKTSHLALGGRPVRAARTRQSRGLQARHLSRPIRPRQKPRRPDRCRPAQPWARERTRRHPARPNVMETPAGKYAPPIERGGHRAAFAVRQRPLRPGLVETLPALTIYSNTAEYLQPARLAAWAMASGQSLGAPRSAPARNAGSRLRR